MQKGKLLLASIAAMLVATPAFAQTAVKIGVLNDRSGIYADLAGEGSVIAARMAVEDFDAKTKGIDVTFVSADHQNKPDVGSNIVRQWVDTEGVNVVVDVRSEEHASELQSLMRTSYAVLCLTTNHVTLTESQPT